VVIIVLQWLLILVPGWVAPGSRIQFMAMFWGPVAGAAALALWWLFASRLRWADRLLGLLTFAVAAAVAYPFCHESVNWFGLLIYALPRVTTVWVLWLVVTSPLPWQFRRVGLAVVFLLAWGYFTLLRFDGVTGSLGVELSYRWEPTAEERFLAERAAREGDGESAAEAGGEVPSLQPGDWPGFRGPNRDGRRAGVRIATDWQAHPPRLVWRQRVGPGWGSFAVVSDRLYTQEQRGPDEVVVCYDANTGSERWAHLDAARFTEQVAGPGPRATPTFHEGRIYALGAAGRLNCLDAATGRPLWSRDIVEDSGAKVPQWGFSSSPLVAAGVVTVFAGGPDGKAVLGYQAGTGKPAWSAGEGLLSYCSPHLARLRGAEQVLIATEVGLTSFAPASGKVLWQHEWRMPEGARVVQPAVVGESDVLLGTPGEQGGTRRLRLEGGGEAAEAWTTRAVKPYFNDLVLHEGHLYGFDGNFLTCVSLDDGEGRWRARGYGNGQVLLLADQGLLLVLSEKGAAALVEASPNGHRKLGQFQAITGKTWNHPVVAHGKLFVRNGEEAACYELAAAE
jgi:outer membrane protein assembly factor BamB